MKKNTTEKLKEKQDESLFFQNFFASRKENYGKTALVKYVFPHFYENLESFHKELYQNLPEEKELNVIDYINKFSARAQDPERSTPPLFVKYYRKNPHELKSDLDNYVNRAINAEVFFKLENVENCNLPEYLYSEICKLVLKI